MIRRLFPYALTLLGGALLLVALPVLLGGSETEPTSVDLANLTGKSPDARWLTLQNGGLWIPEAIEDQRTDKKTDATETKAWYVPYITREEMLKQVTSAVAESAESTGAPAADRLVLIKFSPEAFQNFYPNRDSTDLDKLYQPVDITGLRASNAIFSRRLKNFIRDELKLPLDAVVVINHDREPIQRSQAFGIGGAGLTAALLGLFWIKKRWTTEPAVAEQDLIQPT